MDDTPDLDIGCQEITVKYKKRKKKEPRSKKLKKILDILRSGKETHIIQYTNEEKTEFEVKYVDKKNKKVWSESDISLFLAVDAVSPKPRDQKNLAEETKNRFKSNMLKFVRAGYLKYLGLRKVLKSVVYKKYRILKDFPIGDDTEESCSPQSTVTQSRGSSEDRSHSMGSSSNSSCSFPSTFHYSCLSENLLESDEYEMRADGNEESINNNLPVANEVAAKDYIASETSNLSIGMQYVNRPNWNSEEYQNIPNENEESVNILHEVNEEIAAEDYIAGETSNLSIGMQYVNKPNWNSEIISYGNEGSINIVPVVGAEIEVKDCIADEALNFPIGMKYVNEPNSEEYQNIPNEGSVNILHEVNEEIAAEDNIAGETSNLSIGMQYVNKPNWNNEEYQNIPNGREESVNIQHEANNDEYENIPYKNEESVNILLVMNLVAKGNISDEALIGVQYVNKPNWNAQGIGGTTQVSAQTMVQVADYPAAQRQVPQQSTGTASLIPHQAQAVIASLAQAQQLQSNEYEIIPDGNEKSSNNLPVMNEGVVKDYIAHETSNLSIGTQYVNKPSWNNEEYRNIPNRKEESFNILHEANDAVANWNSEEYKNIPNRNEESIYIPHEANSAVVAKDYIADEALNLSIGMQYVNKPNWNKSNFDDATLFEEMEHDEEILKDSTNPLLSSAVVSEQNTGLISDSFWQTEYKMFSFDEHMYDSS